MEFAKWKLVTEKNWLSKNKEKSNYDDTRRLMRLIRTVGHHIQQSKTWVKEVEFSKFDNDIIRKHAVADCLIITGNTNVYLVLSKIKCL